MKRGAITLSLLFFATSLFGQTEAGPTEKGNMILGGSLSFSRASGDLYQGVTEIQLSPFGGFFLKKNIALGAELKWTTASMENFSSSFIALGPWAAYMFAKSKSSQKVEGTLIPFAKVGFLFRRLGSSGDGWDESASGFMIPIGGGLLYMMSPTLGLLVDAYFSIDRSKNKGADEAFSGNRIVVSVGLSYIRGKS